MSSPATVGGDERLRLFIALRLPSSVVDELVSWQVAALRAEGARAVLPENLHVTVAFLQRRPASDVAAILAELRIAASDAQPMELAPRDYRETPRVGMLRLSDRDLHAHDFAQAVGQRLALRDLYTPESRRWLPHVTVLRFRTPPHMRPALPDLAPFSPSDAALYHSVLRPSGAQYTIIETAALGG